MNKIYKHDQIIACNIPECDYSLFRVIDQCVDYVYLVSLPNSCIKGLWRFNKQDNLKIQIPIVHRVDLTDIDY